MPIFIVLFFHLCYFKKCDTKIDSKVSLRKNVCTSEINNDNVY